MTCPQRKGLIDEKDVRQIGELMSAAAARVGDFGGQEAVANAIISGIQDIVAFPPDRRSL